jgi:WD40 repeat protein
MENAATPSVTEPAVDASLAEEDVMLDETPAYIDMNDAVEVNVDDDVPMDDEDDDEDGNPQGGTMEGETMESGQAIVEDMSRLQLTYHTDAVYAIASIYENGQLSILSGGGDDKAFQYKITTTNGAIPAFPSVQALPYPHTDSVTSVAYNVQHVSDDLKKTPRYAVVGSYDGSIIIYDPDTTTQLFKLEGPSDVEWLSFHPKGGSVLLAGSGDGTLWMFHVPLNKCLQVFVGHEQAVTAGAFSPDGRWALSASADGSLRIWAPKTGLNKHVFRFGDAGLTCMATKGGSDGMLVMVGSEDGQAHVCHIGNKKEVASLRHYDPSTENSSSGAMQNEDDEDAIELPMSVESVGFSPSQPNWCATGGADGKLKIWDLTRDGQCRQICVPQEAAMDRNSDPVEDGLTHLKWHPTLPLVFTASASGTVRLWDARNGILVHTLTGGSEQINDMDIQFVPDTGAALIVTVSDDKTVRVFDLDVKAFMQASMTSSIGVMAGAS